MASIVSAEDNVTKDQLVVEEDLHMKTVTLFYNKADRVVVDSRLLIAPKGITEEQMKGQVDGLAAGRGVYLHNFSEKEDEMELMQVTVATSANMVFLRRVTEMSLASTTDVFCCHKTDEICPVQFGDESGNLAMEDIINVNRSPTSISWREKLVIFLGGRDKSSSRQEMKTEPVVMPLESRPFYMDEAANFEGKTLVVERTVHLEKDSWSREADWKEKIVKGYSIRPSFAGPQLEPPVKPLALLAIAQPVDKKTNRVSSHPIAHEKKERERLSQLETTPLEFLVIDSPVDVATTYELLIKNVGVKRAAWSVKSSPNGLVEAKPTSGIIRPGITTRITLAFAEEFDGENRSGQEADCVEVVWTDVEAETAVFDGQLLLAEDVQKTALPIVYII